MVINHWCRLPPLLYLLCPIHSLLIPSTSHLGRYGGIHSSTSHLCTKRGRGSTTKAETDVKENLFSLDEGNETKKSSAAALATLPRRYPDFSPHVPFPLPNRRGIERVLKAPQTEIGLAALVAVSCLLFSLQTFDGIVGGEPGGIDLGETALAVLDNTEFAIGLVFTAEYVARWYYKGFEPKYLFTPFMLIDFVVILPTILRLFGVPDLVFGGVSYEFLRLLRALRLQRFFNNAPSFQRTFGKVWAGAGAVKLWQLEVARVVSSITTLLFVASGFMYEAEKTANPEFSDFFAALYFGLTTLTTVGFGDIVPVTPAGRGVVGLSILFGIAILPVQLAELANALLRDTALGDQEMTVADAALYSAVLPESQLAAAATTAAAMAAGTSPLSPQKTAGVLVKEDRVLEELVDFVIASEEAVAANSAFERGSASTMPEHSSSVEVLATGDGEQSSTPVDAVAVRRIVTTAIEKLKEQGINGGTT